MTPASSTAAPVTTSASFPDWLPPMLVKELRQGLRTKGFVGLFFTFQVIAALVFWWTLELNAAPGAREIFNMLNSVYWALLMVVLLLVLPWRGLVALRSEMDSRTLDLLVLTRLTAWRIVFGKWFALVVQALLFLLALLPYGVVRYFFGAVDLVFDLERQCVLLLASCALTAVAVFVSTLPKLLRVVVPILLVLGAQIFGIAAITQMFSRASRSGPTVPATMFPPLQWGVFFALVVAILVALALAVRRLAPVAENHAQFARAFVLVVLAGVMIAGQFVPGIPVAMLMFVTVLAVSALELSRDTLPLGVQWRAWRARGRWGAWVGRFALPGWPSAALFAAVALALVAGLAMVQPQWLRGRPEVLQFAWWLVLAWQALVFPAVLLSFLPESSSMRLGGGGYFVVQGLFVIMSLISMSNGQVYFAHNSVVRALDVACHWLPVASFWMSAGHWDTDFTPGRVGAQALAFVACGWLAWRQSVVYWRELRGFDARDTLASKSQP